LLAGDAARLLRAEAQLVQHPSQMASVVRDAEPLANDRGDPFARPQVGREAGFQRSGDHEVDEFIELFDRELADSARMRLR
jgi:hypothetical protein